MTFDSTIKSKDGLINKFLHFLSNKKRSFYVFPVGSKVNLWYWEEQKEHQLCSLETVVVDGKKSVVLVSLVDGNREVDNLREFDFSEIKTILKFVE